MLRQSAPRIGVQVSYHKSTIHNLMNIFTNGVPLFIPAQVGRFKIIYTHILHICCGLGRNPEVYVVVDGGFLRALFPDRFEGNGDGIVFQVIQVKLALQGELQRLIDGYRLAGGEGNGGAILILNLRIAHPQLPVLEGVVLRLRNQRRDEHRALVLHVVAAVVVLRHIGDSTGNGSACCSLVGLIVHVHQNGVGGEGNVNFAPAIFIGNACVLPGFQRPLGIHITIQRLVGAEIIVAVVPVGCLEVRPVRIGLVI